MRKKIYALLLSISLLIGSISCPATVALASDVDCGNKNVQESQSSEVEPLYAEENGWGYYYYQGEAIIVGYYGTDKTITVPDTLGGFTVVWISSLVIYNDSVEEVIIPESEYITTISSEWFINARNLKTIRLSSSAQIEGNTFRLYGCESLESIIVDSDNTNLSSKDGVLFNADGTRLLCYPSAKEGNYVIPDTVEHLGSYAFSNTTKLRDVTIPAGASVNDSVFYGCEGITNFIVDSEHAYCCSEDGVLFNKSKSEIIEFPSGRTGTYIVPDTVRCIKKNAFENSKISEIILNEDLTTIEYSAFYNCVNLREVNIPLDVTAIKYDTFYNCISLKSINIHKNINDISASAFAGCDSLIEFTVDEDNNNYSVYDGMLCNKDKTVLVRFPSGREGEYTIPNSILDIDDEAFYEANKLKVINIPAHINYFDIYECRSLEAINVSPDNQAIASLDGVLYSKDMSDLYTVPAKKSGTFTVPSSVTYIDEYAFWYCKDLEFIVIPKTVTEIAYYNENSEYCNPLWYDFDIDTIFMIEEGSIADRYINYLASYDGLFSVGLRVNYKYCYGHNYEAKVTTEPTCTTKGVKNYICKSPTCKHTYTEELPAKGHAYETITKKANTKSKGSITTKCKNCGDIKSSTVVYSPKTIKLNKTKYRYNGKVRKPSVIVKDSKGKTLRMGKDYTVTYAKGRKNTGRYTVTIKFKGNYSGTVKKTFDIVPKKVNIRKVTPKKKSFTVIWKKQGKQISGYQIKYSTSKKFTKKTTKTRIITNRNKTSFTKNKLKANKSYYVKLRAYKTVKVNGKKVNLYSSWSATKKVTTKK